MDTKCAHLLPILLLLVGLVYAESSCEDSWQQNHYKIYATRGPALSPDETRSLLQQLSDVYAGCVDEESLARKKRVDRLLEVSNISSDKCHLDGFMEFKSLIEYNSIYELNVIPYLQANRGRLFMACKDQLESDLLKQVDALDVDSKQHLSEIRRLAAKNFYGDDKDDVKGPHFLLPKQALERGFLTYVEQLEGPIDQTVSKKTIKAQLKEKFIKYAGRPCGSIMMGLKDSIDIYDLFRYDSNLSRQLGELSKDWMVNVAICREILSDDSSICWDTIDLFLSERPHRSLGHRLKAGLRRHL